MKLRKVLSVILLITIMASNCLYTFAADKDNKDNNNELMMKVDKETGKEYIEIASNGGKIYEAFQYDQEGNLVPIELREYIQIVNDGKKVKEKIKDSKNEATVELSSDKNPPTQTSPLTYTVSRFIKKGSGRTTGNAVKVTADVQGPGSVSYGLSASISNSFSLATGVSYDITEKIKANAGFTWVNSTSNNTVFGVTYNIPDGKKGYVQFTPYLNMVYGDSYMDTYNTAGILISSKSCGTSYGYSPINLSNGYADGLFALVTF